MERNTSAILVSVLVVIIVAGVGLWWSYFSAANLSNKPPAVLQNQGGNTSSEKFDQTISDGTITAAYPSSSFGLATKASQIVVPSNIPPCDQDFNYCLYYIGNKYRATNFESAGVRILKRKDLTTERLCQQTPPTGFDATIAPATTKSADAYSFSIFDNVGGAAAGNFATGSLYRLFIRSNSLCYEFETRVAQSQFSNYPSGTIDQFTASDQSEVQSQLADIVNTISLPGGQKDLFK